MTKDRQNVIYEFDGFAQAFYTQFQNNTDCGANMKIPVIGFAGKAGSGKDSAGMAIISSGIKATKVSFADPIRDMLKCLGIDVDRIYREFGGSGKNEPIPEFGGKSLRFMMQTLGTEWGRKTISDSIWLDIGKRKIRENQANRTFSVVTDVRFDNEAEAIKSLGGVIIQIDSLGNQISEDSLYMKHDSEALISEKLIDYRITNKFYDNELLGRHIFMKDVLVLVNSILKD